MAQAVESENDSGKADHLKMPGKVRVYLLITLQTSNDGIISIFIFPISVPSLLMNDTSFYKKMAALVFAYWLRINISDINVSPDNLADIAARYFFVFSLEWDPDRKHKDLILSNDNKSLTHKKSSCWNTAVLKSKVTIISEGSIQFEVTLRDVEDGAHMMLGWAAASAVDDIQMSNFLGSKSRPTECAFYCNFNCFSQYYHDKHTNFDRKWRGQHLKDGDRIGMIFKGNVCTLQLNDEKVGILSENVPSAIYLAACPYRDITIECTKLEMIDDE